MLKGITPRLAELGKIKIGGKGEERQGKNGAWRLPQKLDHFLITGCGRDAKGDLKVDQKLMERLIKEHGDEDGKLRQIPISLLSDDVDEVISARYCRYDGRKLTATCDGETCTWLRDKAGNAISKPVPCSGEHDAAPWKLHATLACVIASGEASWGGVYKFRTTSRITTDQLYGSLYHLQTLTSGILQGVPLRLVVRPVEVNPDGKATTVYVVHIELRGADLSAVQQQAVQLAQVRIQNERQLRSVHAEYIRLLKAPGEGESDEEQADVAEEFDPGERQALPASDRTALPAKGETTGAREAAAEVVDVKPEPSLAEPAKTKRGKRPAVDMDENGEPVEAKPAAGAIEAAQAALDRGRQAVLAGASASEPPVPPSSPRPVEPSEPTRAELEPDAADLDSLPF